MLTGLKEGNKKKADQYWPDKDTDTMDVGNGVTLKHLETSFQGTYLKRYQYNQSSQGLYFFNINIFQNYPSIERFKTFKRRCDQGGCPAYDQEVGRPDSSR